MIHPCPLCLKVQCKAAGDAPGLGDNLVGKSFQKSTRSEGLKPKEGHEGNHGQAVSQERHSQIQ